MLSEICHEIKNWFDVARFYGRFVISNGTIISQNDGDMGLLDGQYFRVIGSIFNDGVYQYPTTDLIDEEFEGAVWALAIPKEVIALAADIKAWQDKYGDINSEAMSPFSSESFGGYSYSKNGGGAADGSSNAGSWQGVFKSRLNRWRKIR